jgi:hypothetical protein
MLKNKKNKLIALFFVFIFSILLGSFSLSSNAQAAAPQLLINDKVYQDLSAHQHYWWLNACFEIADIDKTTSGEVSSWDYFEGDNNIPILGAMYGKGSDDVMGGRRCSTQEVTQRAFTYLGFTNSLATFCSIPGAQYDGKNVDETTCRAGNGQNDWDNNKSKSERAKWFRDNAASKKPALSKPGEYLRSYLSLVQGCNLSFVNDTLYDSASKVPKVSDANKYAVPVVIEQKNGNNSEFVVKYIQGVRASGSERVSVVSNSTGGSQIKTCDELANNARDNAASYARVLKDSGYNSKQDADKAAGSTDDDATCEGEDCATPPTCAVDGIGWIVCPVMKFLGTMNDAAFGFLNNFLEVPARVFNDAATKAAWETFRNIANVAFIFAFLVIIYSQITSAGVSNYGIKKLLPKLIIAAILVNVSFYICALLVDLSNIFGSNLYNLLKNMNAVSETVSGGGAASSIWTDIVGGALIGVGAIALLAVIIFAPMTLLAFALVMIILIARQAFVILLIVISPLAFVAYLLPNTEQWFKKWWKSLTTMLLVFPIVALVFGASSLASNILLAVSEDCKGSTLENCAENDQGTSDDDQTLKIVAAAVLAIPLFAVPALLKGSMSAAGNIGGKIAGLQGKANGMAGKSIKNSRIGEAKTAFDSRRQKRRVTRRIGDSRIGEINKKIDSSKFGRYIGGERGAALATSELVKASGDEVQRQAILMGEANVGTLFRTLADQSKTAEQRAAAMSEIMDRGGDQHVHEALDYVGKNSKSKDMASIMQKSATAVAKRKPKGLGGTDMSSYKAGDYSGGYEDKLLGRLKSGKIGAADFASMSTDELVRSAEALSKAGSTGKLSQVEFNAISTELQKVRTTDNLKGSMTPERERIFDNILVNQKPSGSDRLQNMDLNDPTMVNR